MGAIDFEHDINRGAKSFCSKFLHVRRGGGGGVVYIYNIFQTLF